MVDNPVSQNKKYKNGSQGRQYSLTQPSSPSSTLRSSRQIYENSRSVPRWCIFEKWWFNTIEVFPSLEKYFSTDHNLTGLTRGLIAGKGRSEFLGTKVEESSIISFLRSWDDFEPNLRPRQSLLLGFPWSPFFRFSPTRWSRCSRDPGFLLVLVK